MPKKKIIRNSDFPYHISARSNNREWFGLHPDKLWDIFSEYLFLSQKLYDLEIHCFVLMSNHFHLIAKTPNADVDLAMLYFLRETSRVIAYETKRINHVYGGPYHPTLITNNFYYMNALKYVFRNPVKANLCQRVEEYPYSTLRGQLGFRQLLIPMINYEELFTDTERFLQWLNTSYSEEENEAIRKALKKREFEISASRLTKKQIQFGQPLFGALQYQKEGRT